MQIYLCRKSKIAISLIIFFSLMLQCTPSWAWVYTISNKSNRTIKVRLVVNKFALVPTEWVELGNGQSKRWDTGGWCANRFEVDPPPCNSPVMCRNDSALNFYVDMVGEKQSATNQLPGCWNIGVTIGYMDNYYKNCYPNSNWGYCYTKCFTVTKGSSEE